MKKLQKFMNVYQIHFISSLIIILLLSVGIGIILYRNLNRIFKEQNDYFEQNVQYQKITIEKRFDSMSRDMERDMIKDQRLKLKTNVIREINRIQQIRIQIDRLMEIELDNTLKAQLYILDYLYNTHKDQNITDNLEAHVLEHLGFQRPTARFFCIVRKDSELIFYRDQNYTKETLPDKMKALLSIDALIDEVSDKTFSFHRFPSPGSVLDDMKISPAVASIAKLDGLDWVIVYGVTRGTVLEDLHLGTRQYLESFGQSSRFAESIRIYELLDNAGGDKFARIVMAPQNPHLNGSYVSTKEIDDQGYPYYGEMLKEVNINGEAYIRYVIADETEKSPSEVLTYFKILPDRRWIVSNSINISDMYQTLANEKKGIQEVLFEEDEDSQLLYDAKTIYSLMRRDYIKLIVILLGYASIGILLSFLISRRVQRTFISYRNEAVRRTEKLTQTNKNLQKEFVQRVKAEREKADLERKTSALAMAVTASHEINQPLMILKGNLELFMMKIDVDSLAPDQIKRLNRISESLERIQKILDKFHEADAIRFEDYTDGTRMVVLDNMKSSSTNGSAGV